MIEKTINELPEILKNHICTLKKASLDASNTTTMSNSPLTVINFDKIPNEYSRGKGWPNVPSSNDALYIIPDGDWYFIEFKNGSIQKSDVFRKIYDSLIMLIELEIIPNFQFSRDNIQYILVYNSDKYPKVQESKNRSANYSYIQKLSQKEERLFEIEKFEKYLFKETHTYTKDIFQKAFVDFMEKQENTTALCS